MNKNRIIRNLFKYKGNKSLTRVLLNTRVENLSLDGLVLDLGSGKREPLSSYYYHFANIDKDKVISVNITADMKPDILADLETALPFREESVDCVLMFNLLEHIYNFERLCSQVYSVLKKGGQCHAFVPFLFRIHEDPYDYFRYSEQALYRVFENACFTNVAVENLGFGACTTFWFFSPSFIIPSVFRFPLLMLFPVCLKIDEFVDRRAWKNRDKPFSSQYPIAYFITCEK